MDSSTYINAYEFIETLKERGLVIVSVNEFEAGKALVRKKLMKRTALSLTEIVKNGLLPVGTTKAVIDWTISGKIKKDEWYQEQNGRKRIMVLTAAIKRLGYVD
jgi:hypothetical protein